MNPADHYDFYAELWPVLKLPGWNQATGRAIGEAWWYRPVETASPDLSARLCLIRRSEGCHLTLVVRHYSNQLASTAIGNQDLTPEQVMATVAERLPALEAEALEKYRQWSAQLDAKYHSQPNPEEAL